MRKVVSLFFVLFCLYQPKLIAQIPGLTQFTTNNGLPSNTIYDTVQDENGFIWFATDYGISKFDGLNFKNYSVTDGLPGNEILSFFKDSSNRIWMSGFNGDIGFIKNGTFYNKENLPFLKKLNSSTFITNLFEDSKGQIWFYQNFGSIKVLQPNLSIKTYALKSNSNLKFSAIIVEDLNKQIHVLTHIRVNNKTIINTKPISKDSDLISWKKFDSKKFPNTTLETINNKLGLLMREENIIIKNIYNYLINETNYFLAKAYLVGENYWITNINNGGLIFNKSNNYNNPKIILKNIKTNTAYVDLENNVWIGSQSNGVFLFPNIHINGIQFENSIRNNLYPITIFQDKIVVGNDQSEIIILNAETLKIIASHKLDMNLKRVRHLKSYNELLLILDDFGIFQMDENMLLRNIKNMFDSDFHAADIKNFKDLEISGNQIYTANANGVVKINRTTKSIEKLWDKRSSAICLVGKDSLWIGTTTGLYLNNAGTTKKYDLSEEFNNTTIYAIENGANGLLIGSNSHGLGILKNRIFKKIDITDGLLSNNIRSIFIDSINNIWLSTNFGLICIELNKNNEITCIKSYTTSDGLYSNDVRDCFVKNNKVYVATSNGLNIIDLSKEATSIIEPRTHINEILLNNTPIDKTNNQTFGHNFNNIQFNFSGISFKSLGNITFKYRLVGLESEWITTKSNIVRYSELPPNNYTFELKSISKNNLESSAPILFGFSINPPIYKTWWFISIALISLIGLIAYIFHRRNLKWKNEQQLKEKILTLRYQALNAQMNPHFINNTLVNINGLIVDGNLEEVKGSLDNFAGLVNLILESTKSNLISLTDEIEIAKLYLNLQKLRFNKNSFYSINTTSISQEELDGIMVPPMILQPIIENSFKHGFKNENETNRIVMNFNIENEQFLVCEIIDNGFGIRTFENSTSSTSSGISFSNINERLQLINESKSEEKLVIISNVTNEFNNLVGLKVILKIPLTSY
ncbi:two-component regulator propeller domain-containing protein [Lutibacter sp.]|uniref:sensor histidine kinase n=1 Tax=Lutibacter sp. TaxID=1925666 RepID=UPI002736DF17|nr:two-component regulator propeller domain-containing protein [Lutibacter sp.]MDP3314217.1 two-component regulator propeller domain-containing protein [Lutibacter sp.]